MSWIKDFILTALVGAGLAELFLRGMTALGIPVPLQDGKRPVFVVGIILFSLAFRLLSALRRGSEEG